MVSTWLYLLFLGAVALERLYEVRVSNHNARIAFAQGALEYGRRHYRVMVFLHSLFLPACAAEVALLHRPFPGAPGWVALTIACGSQALRYTAIRTLGERWNTRIIVLPEAPPVTGGIYRYLRHPNYVAVIAEMLAIPLIHGAWICAIAFSCANALLLTVRIRAEERALGGQWQEAFASRRRFIPGGVRG
jgi:methyltransferase